MANKMPTRPPTWPPEKRKNPRKLSKAAKVATVCKRRTTWLRQPALLGGRADHGGDCLMCFRHGRTFRNPDCRTMQKIAGPGRAWMAGTVYTNATLELPYEKIGGA